MKERLKMKDYAEINEPVGICKTSRDCTIKSSNFPKTFKNYKNSAARNGKIRGIRADRKDKRIRFLREDSQIHEQKQIAISEEENGLKEDNIGPKTKKQIH